MRIEFNHHELIVVPETEFEKEVLYEYFGGGKKHTVFLKHGLSSSPDYLLGLKISEVKEEP